MDACGEYHSLSCWHSDVPDSLITHTLGKKDFGIEAVIIVAIIAGTAMEIIAAIALIQTATMAETVSEVISNSAEVLQGQEVLNQHLY